MSHWNYRIIKHNVDGIDLYCIHEVYYDDNHIPTGHCSTATGGEDEETLRKTYELMAEAFDSPILKLTDFAGKLREH